MVVAHLTNARRSVLYAPDPTSPGIGAVRNVTGHHHQNNPLFYRRTKPAPRNANAGEHGSQAGRPPGLHRRGPSLLPPNLLLHPRILARGLPGPPSEAPPRPDLPPRGPPRARAHLPPLHRTRRHPESSLLTKGMPHGPLASDKDPRILSMIVAQLPQLASSTRRPTPKLKRVNKPQTPWPLPQRAEADRQPTILTATSAASPGPSGGAPLDLSALLDATQNSNTHDGGQRL
ncbi:hypothetical protein HPB51_022633 [Rhipicephalus microplus]|uniref:Uncharacterized protein n=1 Tax=Rhipicephalus microplus TaxID=6941 RepID=A0A9J6ED36_RHIMP|nr:hypothetical protein HPB51_022633 [Rhipicephalus microplus]